MIPDGKINIDGEDSMALDQTALMRKIGYVIQSNGLFPNMTIEENVIIVPDRLGWYKEEKKERFHKLMEMIGLSGEKFGKRYPHELSEVNSSESVWSGHWQQIHPSMGLKMDPTFWSA